MSQKRKFREDYIFDDIVSVNEPSSSATLHGVVTSLSPMKKGKSCEYFDGSLSDETANIGFSTSVRRKLLQHNGIKMIQLLYHTVRFSIHEKTTIWK